MVSDLKMIRQTTTPEGEKGFDPLDHDAHFGILTLKKKNVNQNFYQVSFPNKIKRILWMQKFICIPFIVHSHCTNCFPKCVDNNPNNSDVQNMIN